MLDLIRRQRYSFYLFALVFLTSGSYMFATSFFVQLAPISAKDVTALVNHYSDGPGVTNLLTNWDALSDVIKYLYFMSHRPTIAAGIVQLFLFCLAFLITGWMGSLYKIDGQLTPRIEACAKWLFGIFYASAATTGVGLVLQLYSGRSRPVVFDIQVPEDLVHDIERLVGEPWVETPMLLLAYVILGPFILKLTQLIVDEENTV